MKLINNNVLYESLKDDYDLVLPKGTILFHGTGETINGDLRPGGYDNLLWTTSSSAIAQTYISVASIRNVSSKTLSSPPMHGKKDGVFTNFLGVSYDVKFENGVARTYTTLAPDIFKKWEAERYELIKQYNEYRKELDSKEANFIKIAKQAENDDSITEEEINKLAEENNKLYKEFKNFKVKYNNYNVKLLKNQYVNEKLRELGYSPDSSSGEDEDYLWNIKEDINGNVMSNDYRQTGRLYIIKLKRDMKIYDISTGESDEMELQYNSLDLFNKVEKMGYDGVKIDDFAQTESYGNVMHTSVGFFKSSFDGLDYSEFIPDVVHPKDPLQRHSDEYIKHRKSLKESNSIISYKGELYEEIVNNHNYNIEKIKRDPNYNYSTVDGVVYRITRGSVIDEISINRIEFTDENEFYEDQINRYVEYLKNGGIIEPFPVNVSKLEYNLDSMISFLDDNKEFDDDIDEAFHNFTSNNELGIRRYSFYRILTDTDEGEKFYKWHRLNPKAISIRNCFPSDITSEEKQLIPFLEAVFKFFEDNEEYTLINQNHRLEALKRLGKTKVLIRKY